MKMKYCRDVTGLLDSSGNEVVTYSYDSWGKLLSIGGSLKDTVGVKNPFRYRSYYYDTETGAYYLQSRYYNPEIGRFISKDDTSYHQVKMALLQTCMRMAIITYPGKVYLMKDGRLRQIFEYIFRK